MANLTNEKAEFAIAIFRHFSPFFAIFRHWPPPIGLKTVWEGLVHHFSLSLEHLLLV